MYTESDIVLNAFNYHMQRLEKYQKSYRFIKLNHLKNEDIEESFLDAMGFLKTIRN